VTGAKHVDFLCRGMNILLATGIFPPDIGGPASYVPEIARALLQKGHKVKVVTTSEPEWLDFDDGQHPFQVFRMNRRLDLALRPFYFAKTILHHSRDADVVLANGVFLEAAVASFLSGKSMVQKIVGDPAWERAVNRGWLRDRFETFQERRYGLKVEGLKKLRTFVANQAEKIIVPSHYLADWVRRWGVPQHKISIIYNSVPEIGPVPPVSTPLTSRVKLVTAGRLVSWKCIDSIIEAVGRMDDVGLLICGDGPERTQLEQLAKDLGVTDRIYFAGQRNRKDALALMADCDIFVLASTYEGLPHVVLEAMSLGLPVIATSVGGIPELVQDGETGVLIEGGDAEALRAAVLELIASPELLQRMKNKAQLKAKTFSLSRMVEETERVLQTVSRRSSAEQEQ